MYCVFVGNDYNLYMENGSSIAFVFVYPNNYIIIVVIYSQIVGERAKRARHSQVCSIENRGYIYKYYIYIMVRAIFVLITRKEGGA